VCEQAAASITGQDHPVPPEARRDPRRLKRALRSLQLSVAGSVSTDETDGVLGQVLVDCINECRRLAGERAVDPRLPLADCPRRLAVRPRAMRSPGCDWIETGYEPVLSQLPACLLREVAVV
jgi:hypothetical protein